MVLPDRTWMELLSLELPSALELFRPSKTELFDCDGDLKVGSISPFCLLCGSLPPPLVWRFFVLNDWVDCALSILID